MAYRTTGIDATDWPRRAHGGRRRASADGVISRRKLYGPVTWLIRAALLLLIAAPSLIVTSPSYAAYAEKLPDVAQMSKDVPGDTLVYAADGTTLLADLHPPGHQHYYEPLSAMGTYLPEAVVSIEDRNFYDEPGVF